MAESATKRVGSLAIERPNQAWAADITYLPMTRGFAYLVAILDLYQFVEIRLGTSTESRSCTLSMASTNAT